MASNTVPAAVPGPNDPPHSTAPTAPTTGTQQQPGGLAGLLAPVEPTRSAAFSITPDQTTNGLQDDTVAGASSSAFNTPENTVQDGKDTKNSSGTKQERSVVRAWLLAGAERWRKGADARNKALDIKKAKAQARQVKENVTVNRAEKINSGSTNSGSGNSGNSGKSLNNKTGKNNSGGGAKNSSGAGGRGNAGGTGKESGGGKGSGGGTGGGSGTKNNAGGSSSGGRGTGNNSGSGSGSSGSGRGGDRGGAGRDRSTSSKDRGPSGTQQPTTFSKRDNGSVDKPTSKKTDSGTKPSNGGSSGGTSSAGKPGPQGPSGKPGKDTTAPQAPKPSPAADTRKGPHKPTNAADRPDLNTTDPKTPKTPKTTQTPVKPGPAAAPGTLGKGLWKDQLAKPTADQRNSKDPQGGKGTGLKQPGTIPAPAINLQKSRETGYRDGTRAAKAVAHAQAWRDGARDGYRDTTEAADREKQRLDKAHADRKNARTHPEDQAVTQPNPTTDPQAVPRKPTQPPTIQPVQVTGTDATHIHLGDNANRTHISRGEVRTLRRFQQRLDDKTSRMTQVAEATRTLEHHAKEQNRQVTELLEQARAVEGGDKLVAALTKLQEAAQAQIDKAADVHKRAVRSQEACKTLHANTDTRYGGIYQAVVDSPEATPAELSYYREMSHA